MAEAEVELSSMGASRQHSKEDMAATALLAATLAMGASRAVAMQTLSGGTMAREASEDHMKKRSAALPSHRAPAIMQSRLLALWHALHPTVRVGGGAAPGNADRPGPECMNHCTGASSCHLYSMHMHVWAFRGLERGGKYKGEGL